tara:strand:- start:5198 stop:6508 length:1311 start_codon:yes stop_codon:yes gene_type:complete
MKIILTCILLLIIIIISLLYKTHIVELFVSQISKSYDSNKFQPIVLDKMDNYDIELAIPSGQYLYNTIQGNWGFSTDETNNGVVFGVYRDGYTSDGSVFKGKSGKRYKYMLEQGPYVIKYEVRKNNGTHDVSIFVDNKLIKLAKNEGISSDKIKVIGTNYHNYNNEAKKDERGRRPVDYIKFIPKDVNTKSIEGMEQRETTQPSVNYSPEVKKTNNISNSLINEAEFITKLCKDEGIFCNKIQDFNVNLQTGKIYYGMSEEDKNKQHQLKNTISDQENDLNLKHLFDTADQNKDGLILESELKMLMTNLEINKETYDTVMKQITPAGMDYKTFSSLIGSPVKSILKVVYEDNGKQGLKMMYKLMGYEYVENKQQQQQKKEIEKKKRQALLKKRYPEPEYDKSNPSKTRYRRDYKPEHPRPINGVHFYDSIWDFNNK